GRTRSPRRLGPWAYCRAEEAGVPGDPSVAARCPSRRRRSCKGRPGGSRKPIDTIDRRVGTFRRLLVERGYRVTSQRLAIYRYLIGTDSHPTADDIYQALQKQFPTMS